MNLFFRAAPGLFEDLHDAGRGRETAGERPLRFVDGELLTTVDSDPLSSIFGVISRSCFWGGLCCLPGRAGHANLMQGFRTGAGWGVGCAAGEGAGVGALGTSLLGFAVQANEIHRFFSMALIAGSLGNWVEVVFVFCPIFASLVGVAFLGKEPTICTPDVTWCLSTVRGAKPMCGRRGLGVLVLAGVLRPVSLVRSAVEAREISLLMDRRRRKLSGAVVLSAVSPSEAL